MHYYTIPAKKFDDVELYSRCLLKHEVRYWVSVLKRTSHSIIYQFHLECTEEACRTVCNELRIKLKGVNA